jgi:hypothetical protein
MSGSKLTGDVTIVADNWLLIVFGSLIPIIDFIFHNWLSLWKISIWVCLFTTRNLSFKQKESPRIPKETMRYLRGAQWLLTLKESLEYSTMSVQHTTRNPWNTLKCLYKVPQGILGALSTMSIYGTHGVLGVLRHVYIGSSIVRDAVWFSSNELWVFYPRVLARG